MATHHDDSMETWLSELTNLSPHVVGPSTSYRDVLGPACHSQNELKLLSEEYRACSVRADELAKLIWQTFLGVLALSGAAGGAVMKSINDETGGRHAVLLVASCILVTSLLAKWKAISAKWNLQQQALYGRLNHLERCLGFRTNVQFRRVDKASAGTLGAESNALQKSPLRIGNLREEMARALVIWWAILGGVALYSVVEKWETLIPSFSAMPAREIFGVILGLVFFGVLVGWYVLAPGRIDDTKSKQ